MEAELRAFLRELHTEQQAKLQAQYIDLDSKLLKAGSGKNGSTLSRCSILLGLIFVEIKNSCTETLLVFNSKNFRIICFWKKTDEYDFI